MELLKDLQEYLDYIANQPTIDFQMNQLLEQDKRDYQSLYGIKKFFTAQPPETVEEADLIWALSRLAKTKEPEIATPDNFAYWRKEKYNVVH